MGQPAEKLTPRATLADLDAVPPPRVAELIRGVLYTFGRPAPKHARAASRLGRHLGPFDDDPGEPGGWIILDEPEIHFPDPTEPGAVDAVAPDLAGWRRERMPKLPEEAFFTVAPDWICEVLSPSTEAYDRAQKMPLYARAGVRHAWLVDPIVRTLEVFALEGGRWVLLDVHRDDALVRAAPFDVFELASSSRR